MTRFERGIKEVIAQNSRYTVDEIELTDSLDKFISSFMADRLAREIKRKFNKVNTTGLTNELYVTIKKVSELVTKISVLYTS
ncbi:MAG TPA: hypothetical protein VLY84_06225 [Dysgonamonadaceae bacterium]|nr:hypothetical protein [Dysgonamonadaceae bacterium]